MRSLGHSSNKRTLGVAPERCSGIGGLLATIFLMLITGCQSMNRPPMETVDQVDLKRFMGDWYVIASIPTFIEKKAYNAVESYSLDSDGTVATVFTFREGGFDGELKRYNPPASCATPNPRPAGACSSCGPSRPTTESST